MNIDKWEIRALWISNLILSLAVILSMWHTPETVKVEETGPINEIVITTEPVEGPTTEETEPQQLTQPTEETTDTEEPEPPQVDYTTPIEIDDYLYVTADCLNIRSGPGTEYEVLGVLLINDQVHRIGEFGDWSAIEYYGGEAYVSSKYLSYEEQEITEPSYPIKNDGSMGRLYIPSVGVNVAIYGDYTQETVDREDSAAYLYGETKYGQEIIADHVHQGFSGIKKAIPGSTTLYIDFGEYQTHYICVDNFKGYNTGNDLTNLNGTSITGQNNNGLCLYTCNSDGTITITFWQRTV